MQYENKFQVTQKVFYKYLIFLLNSK